MGRFVSTSPAPFPFRAILAIRPYEAGALADQEGADADCCSPETPTGMGEAGCNKACLPRVKRFKSTRPKPTRSSDTKLFSAQYGGPNGCLNLAAQAILGISVQRIWQMDSKLNGE
jgi:hypothetical protein